MTEQKSPQISIALSVEAVNLILEGLAMLPLGRSRSLFDAIQAEAQKQLAPPAPEAAPESEPK